jgi:hypothetical protein
MSVYKAINAVQGDLAKVGIAKDSKNTQQGYSFRGIDAVYNVLSPLLAKHGLCILPRVVSREVVERQGKSGGALFYVTVGVEFDFVAAEDGSKHTVVTYGEAMDSGDKATNKAMSAAYKYACMQAFSIPTEGDNDADASTHEVQPMPNRTMVMKCANNLLEHLANDRDFGALQEWQEAVAQGEEFAGLVWSCLPTPARDTIRRLQNEARTKAA